MTARTSTLALPFFMALGIWSGAASAGEPVAIVERISAAGSDLSFMDYLSEGQVIELRAGESLTLGYLSSCWVEEIRGGRVLIGRLRSEVKHGSVTRKQVDCAGGGIRLSDDQGVTSGVVVFRKPPGTTSTMPKAQITLHGTSPMISLVTGKAGTVVIERLDKSEERHALVAKDSHLDLAEIGISLAPGGLYRAVAGKSQVVFRIDPFAEPGATPIIGRLLSL